MYFILPAALVVLILATTLVVVFAKRINNPTKLQNAVRAAQNGDVIVVAANMSVSGDIVLDVDKTYTLCGKNPGVTVTLESGSFLISSGNVTIKNIRIVANENNAVKITGAGSTVTVGESDGTNENTYIESKGSVGGDSKAATGCALWVELGKLNVKSGTFYGSNRAANGCNLIIDDGVFYQNRTLVSTQDVGAHLWSFKDSAGRATVNGGTFVGAEGTPSALVYAASGKLAFSGGTFTTKGDTLFDIALQKAAGDSFEISDGTYILEEASNCGVILRTTVGVSAAEVDKAEDADTTKVFYWSDVDIKLTGGTFVDRRATLSPLIDANVSNSLVVVGDAVLLSRYAKRCFVAVNGAVGSDIAFAQNTATVQHDGVSYYCYRACGQEANTTNSSEREAAASVSVTPSTTVTLGDGFSANLQNKAKALGEKLGDLGYTSAGTPIFAGSKGALAEAALAKIEGYGYYIGVIDNTIVIAGSNNALVMQAIDVFAALCVGGGDIRLTEIVVSDVDMVALNVEIPFVYSYTRDANVHNIYMREIKKLKNYAKIVFNSACNHLYNYEDNSKTQLDYPLVAAMELARALHFSAFNCSYLSDRFNLTGPAIHIGLTKAARDFLARNNKPIGYYGYFIKDGNVVITSYDDATLRLAKALFVDDLADYALDVNGDGVADVYAYPADYDFEHGYNNGFTGAFDTFPNATGDDNVAAEVKKLLTDFPRPSGLPISGVVNVSNGELEVYYLNATVANYQSYCEQLADCGYTVYMAERAVEGSYYVTYVNRSTDIMLRVMYTAYAHASRQKLGEDNTLDAMFEPTLRIISSRITDSISYMHHILPEKLHTKQAYTKRTDAKLTMPQLDIAGCFLFTLEDGSFVVIDGGNGHKGEVTNFYNVLVSLHTDIYGTAPTAENPIRIAAWYLTHPHCDHTRLLEHFYAKYMDAESPDFANVVIDAIVGNFPSNDEAYNAHSVDQSKLNLMGTPSWYKNSVNGNDVPVQFYNVHTGYNFFIGNLEFEVLFTTEDMHPWAMRAFNNGSIVIRLTVHAHDVEKGSTVPAGAAASSKTNCLAIGDIYTRTARVLRATYGDYLESDMMTVGHHGSGAGGEGELYKMINPKVILWPNKASAVKNYSSNKSNRGTVENRKLLFSTHWRYILANRAIDSVITKTDEEGKTVTYRYYNPTIIFTKDGVPGLGAASTDAEIRSEAEKFVSALENVVGSAPISYGTGYYVDEDFSRKAASIEPFAGGSCVWWRGNYFSDVTFPARPAYPVLPKEH